MTFPAELKVGPLTYKLISDPIEDADGNSGATYPDLGRIKLSPYVSEDVLRLTVWHEAKHACANLAGIDSKDELSEEEWITRTSAPELAMLRENQALVRYLLA